jgi:hypothetical protein
MLSMHYGKYCKRFIIIIFTFLKQKCNTFESRRIQFTNLKNYLSSPIHKFNRVLKKFIFLVQL